MSPRDRPGPRRRGPEFSAWTFVAPVALVLAVVIAVSIVRAASRHTSTVAATSPGATATAPTTSTESVPTTTATPPKRYYKVKRGDTFESIESSLGLAPATLVKLNPKADPLKLQPGQRLRVQ